MTSNDLETRRSARIDVVRANLAARGISQLFVCDPRSVQYLTGWYIEPGERFFGLLLQAGATRPILFANELFPVPDGTGCEVVTLTDTDDAPAALAARLDTAAALGCDKNLPARFLIPLMERSAAAGFTLASDTVDAARALKDPAEQELMRAASAANDEAMTRFCELVHEGMTEREVASQLEGIYRELGASGHSFAPIVCFGTSSADPHHEPDDTRLAPGDAVLFDVGCRKDEYCSDMTRTFFYRSVSDEQRAIYELVHRANEAGKAAVRPGTRFCDIDAAARSVIAEAGYVPNFTHRLGHQAGLDVHEPGDVSGANTAQVQPGMVFSIEPGVYLPGRFGVRIEDLVLVTEDGCEVLNRYPRELTVLE